MMESRPWGTVKEKPKDDDGATSMRAATSRGCSARALRVLSATLEAEFWTCADAIAH